MSNNYLAPTAARTLARRCMAALEVRREAIAAHRANVRAFRASYDVGKRLWWRNVKTVIGEYITPEGYKVSGWVDPSTGLPPPVWGQGWRERLEETGIAAWEANREYHRLLWQLRAAIIVEGGGRYSQVGAASLRRNVWGGKAL